MTGSVVAFEGTRTATPGSRTRYFRAFDTHLQKKIIGGAQGSLTRETFKPHVSLVIDLVDKFGVEMEQIMLLERPHRPRHRP